MSDVTVDSLRQPPSTTLSNIVPGFGTRESFELLVRQARVLSSTNIVPATYRKMIEKKSGRDSTWEENPNGEANCIVALNMALRLAVDPIMVMQNLHIIEGRPSWSSPWIIAQILGCGRFSGLWYDIKKLGNRAVPYIAYEWDNSLKPAKKTEVKTDIPIEDMECIAWALPAGVALPPKITTLAQALDAGLPVIEGSKVSMSMAVQEGWYTKNGSKWKTMPGQMIRYRAAAFFGRIEIPDRLLGLLSQEEALDAINIYPQPDGTHAADLDELRRTEESRPEAERAAEAAAHEMKVASAETVTPTKDSDAVQSGAAASEPASGAPADAAQPAQQAADSAEHTIEPGQTGSLLEDGDTLEMALSSVENGDYDAARDLKRGLGAAAQREIEDAIAKAQAAPAPSPTAKVASPAAKPAQAAQVAQARPARRSMSI